MQKTIYFKQEFAVLVVQSMKFGYSIGSVFVKVAIKESIKNALFNAGKIKNSKMENVFVWKVFMKMMANVRNSQNVQMQHYGTLNKKNVIALSLDSFWLKKTVKNAQLFVSNANLFHLVNCVKMVL